MTERPYTKDVWENGAAPMVLILPGATGTQRPKMRGFDAIAAMFWLQGYGAYVFSAPGQDNNGGEYCTHTYLSAARSCLEALCLAYKPSAIVLFGSCAGGIIAAYLASEQREIPTILVLWESMFHYSNDDIDALINKATQTKELVISRTIYEVIQFDSFAGNITCPTLIAFGPQQPIRAGIFMQADVRQIEQKLATPSHCIETLFIPFSTHNLTRNGPPVLLAEMMVCVLSFVKRQLNQRKVFSQ